MALHNSIRAVGCVSDIIILHTITAMIVYSKTTEFSIMFYGVIYES
jgi:hypothetical protein